VFRDAPKQYTCTGLSPSGANDNQGDPTLLYHPLDTFILLLIQLEYGNCGKAFQVNFFDEILIVLLSTASPLPWALVASSLQ